MEKYRRVMSHDTEEWCKVWRKTLGSKNDMKNLVSFNVSSGKSENLHFEMLLLSIAYKVSATQVQKNYLSWHWKVIQTLKKNWLSVWKMTWGIWWILKWPVKSLKICTLMGYFCKVENSNVWAKKSCVVKNYLLF